MEKIDYSSLKKEDFLKEQKDRHEIFEKIANSISSKSFDDEDVQAQILNLFNWMNKFYDCSIEMFKGLAEVYEFNSDFSQTLIKNYGENMPTYLSKAIVYFCDEKSKH